MAAEPGEKKRRLPKSPVRKPDFDAWGAGKSALVGILLLPVALVVGFAAQVLELLYYLAVGLFYLVTSPYWITRTLYRALRPANTPERVEQRKQAREAVATFFKVSGCLLLIAAVLIGGLVGLVLLLDR